MTEITTKYYNSTIPRIDPELKAKWVAALRSGKYKQGYRALKDAQGGFCCLGVYCEAMGVPTFVIEGSVTMRDDGGMVTIPSTTMYGSVEPGKARSWADIPVGYGPKFVTDEEDSEYGAGDEFVGEGTIFFYEAPGYREWVTLPGMNDHDSLSLAQIADVIDYFL